MNKWELDGRRWEDEVRVGVEGVCCAGTEANIGNEIGPRHGNEGIMHDICIGPLIVPGIGAGAGMHLIKYFRPATNQSSLAEGLLQ